MKINWLGIIASISIILVLVTTVMFPSAPWWRLTVGSGAEYMAKVDISPFNIDITVLDLPVEIPFIQYVTLGATLTFVAAAIAMIIGSLYTEKSWSKLLIDFAYLKPTLILVFFVALLLTGSRLARSTLDFEIPIVGQTTLTYNFENASVLAQTLIPINTHLSWTFYLAVIAAIVSLAVKIYHTRMYSKKP